MGYKVGDIVRMTNTYWYGNNGESREDIGKLYVISEVHNGKYEIRKLSSGSTSAWWHDNQLEYVREAESDIFEQLDNIQDNLRKKHRTMEFIQENFPDHMPATSWLYLFERIGYDSSFNRNGEYFILHNDIMQLYPVFDCIFKKDLDKALENVDKVFKPSYADKYKNNVIRFYNELNVS